MHKRILFPLGFILGLFLVGCTAGSSSLSVIEYNNKIVDILNTTSAAIEDTTSVYDASVPNIVTEESEVDTAAMQASYDEAMAQITAAYDVIALESRDAEQQTAVSAEFANYLELGSAYLTNYGEMVEYYSSSAFVENLDGVAEYDETLHTGYNDFIESNNALVDILASFVE